MQAITDSPIDIEFGPDGSLYVLDYGNGFFRANPDAGLYRVDWSPGNKSPTARISADPISSAAPLTVELDGSGSTDPEGGALTYEWDFTGDGTFDATGVDGDPHVHDAGQVHRPPPGHRPPGQDRHHELVVRVGNVAPTVNVSTPNGGFFEWGQAVPVTVTTSDPEDGTATVCSRVSWTFGLGHDAHAHPRASARAASSRSPPRPTRPSTARPRTSSASSSSPTPTRAPTASGGDDDGVADPQPVDAGGRVGRRGPAWTSALTRPPAVCARSRRSTRVTTSPGIR